MGLLGKQRAVMSALQLRASTSAGIALVNSLSNHPIKKDILKAQHLVKELSIYKYSECWEGSESLSGSHSPAPL